LRFALFNDISLTYKKKKKKFHCLIVTLGEGQQKFGSMICEREGIQEEALHRNRAGCLRDVLLETFY
jgi:hypothetical protein